MALRLHQDGQAAFPGRLEYGEVEADFASAPVVTEDTIITQKIHHAAMEPHAVLAVPRPEGILEVHTPCQIMFGVQHSVASVVPLPLSKIKIIKVRLGGAFGGKQEVVFEPLCAWAAWKLGRAVFINLNRTETMLATRTRAGAVIRVRTALSREGKILARHFEATIDAGAYLTGTKKVMMAMGKKTSRLYRLPALRFDGRTIRTSTTPAGACRGYGSPQIHAATEIHTDLLCRRLGFDPVEFRLQNLVKPFDQDPSGAADLGNARIIECLEKGLAAFGWQKRKKPSASGRFRRGAGLACATHGNGYFKTIYHDVTGMSLRLLEDGSAVLRAGVHELGNAAMATLAIIAAEVLSIPPERITVLEGDTLSNNYDIGCQASRGIFVMGECARLCAEKALKLLLEETEKLFGSAVKMKNGLLKLKDQTLPIGEAVRLIEMKNSAVVDVSVQHRPTQNPASYGVHFTEVNIDTLTGLVRVEKYLAVHDVGQAINPSFVKGQIYGGIQMGLGMAFTEELSFDSQGNPSARNFDKYHLVNAPDMPEMEVILVEQGEEGGPFGAKSIGEIATVPVAPAAVNAVNRALGSEMTILPLSPTKIVSYLLKNNKL
jgi:xanthine dehydrogenase molybdenum-binding subunit